MMTSRSTLSLLVVAALLGLSMAVKTGRAPADQEQEEHKPRDSWKKLVVDMQGYLKVLSDNSVGLENSLKALWEKVDKELELNGKENYNLWYAKKLLNEQRAVIDALRSGLPLPTSDDEQVAEPAVVSDSTVDNSKRYEALNNLKNL